MNSVKSNTVRFAARSYKGTQWEDAPPALVVRDGPAGLLTMRATSLIWLAIRPALILSLSKDRGGPGKLTQS